MARYRKVDPRIWNDAKFRRLSDSAKLVFFMLLTHPNMTALGAMRATLAGLAEELGWEAEAFTVAFREVLFEGMAEHDQKACFVSLPNFLRYNPPESPNVVKAWVGAIDLLPECNQKFVVIQRSIAFAKGMSEGFREALPEAFGKGMPYQEQEQEQKLAASPSASSTAKAQTTDTAKGTRLATDWVLPEEWRTWTMTARPDLDPGAVAESFRDYWVSKPGKDGRKTDWQATWRNWCRNQKIPHDPGPKKSVEAGSFV